MDRSKVGRYRREVGDAKLRWMLERLKDCLL